MVQRKGKKKGEYTNKTIKYSRYKDEAKRDTSAEILFPDETVGYSLNKSKRWELYNDLIHNNNNNNLDNNNIGEKKEEQEEETITIFHYSCGDSINANTTSQLNQEGFSNGRLLFDYPKKQRGVFVVHSGSLSDPEEKNNNHHFNSKKSKKQRKKHIKQNLSKEERRERVESNKFKRRKERQIRQEGRNSLNNNSDDSSNDDTNNNEEGKYSNNHNSNNTNQHKRIVRLSDKKQNYKMKKIPYCCPLCEGSKPPLQGSAKKRKGAQKKNKLALHQETEF